MIGTASKLNLTENNLNELDFLSSAKAIWEYALHENLPSAIWRLPNSTTIHLITDFSGKAKIVDPDFEELPKGFLCSPFLSDENKEAFFLEADLHLSWEEEKVVDFSKPGSELFKEKVRKFHSEQPVKNGNKPAGDKIKNNIFFKGKSQDTEKQFFFDLIEKGIEEIEKGNFRKVVLSRKKEIQLPNNFDVVSAFQKLCKAYSTAFISLLFLPDRGVWLGASPETLVSFDNQGIFKTIALAGTQRNSPEINLKEVNWTMKEIEEQALVSRYVINCFKKIRVREYEEDGPKTVAAGNLIHLRTDFTIDSKEINFPQLPTVMLKLLHPTSAVCGMPKEPALEFIKNNEKYDRQLYSGYIGPVNISGESHVFVNLRCLQVFAKNTEADTTQGILYAGAGITVNSQPEKEWLETELKCQTILDALE